MLSPWCSGINWHACFIWVRSGDLTRMHIIFGSGDSNGELYPFFLQKQSFEDISSLPELWKNVNLHITVWTSCGSDFLCTSREGRWPGDTQMPFSKITRRKLKDLRRIIYEHKLDRAVFTLEDDWTGKSSNNFFFFFSFFSFFIFLYWSV